MRLSLVLKSVAIATLLVACTATASDSTAIHCADCPAIPVERVIDGDTFDSINATVRLYGVDAPEQGEPCYAEATARLSELAGDSVRLEAGPRQEDGYGRLLFYTYTLDGQSIDEILIQEGLAKVWTRDGQHRWVLIAEEENAIHREEGCWTSIGNWE
jgi:micrococcal nuclease